MGPQSKSDGNSGKQQSRFSRGGFANINLSRFKVSGDQRSALAEASHRFLSAVRNRKASPKGK